MALQVNSADPQTRMSLGQAWLQFVVLVLDDDYPTNGWLIDVLDLHYQKLIAAFNVGRVIYVGPGGASYILNISYVAGELKLYFLSTASNSQPPAHSTEFGGEPVFMFALVV